MSKNVINSLLRNDFPSFIKKCFYTVNPGDKYHHNWHIDLIAEYLLACEKSEIKRLIINVPPRSLKSLCVSVAWTAWLLGHNPSRRIIASSYAQGLSLKHSLDTRLVMNSHWYKEIFPTARIIAGENEKAKFVTNERGFRFATSTGGTITGEGGNFLIADDPHNPSDIFSDTIRQNTLDWFSQSFASRLNDKKKGRFVIVMQRLHENDLSGFLLEKGNWEHLSIPATAERKTIYQIGDFNIVRNIGDILHNERENKKLLEMAKHDLGSYAFSAQYMQNPVPVGGGMIKPSWIKRYKTYPANPDNIVQSWDTAIKSGVKNDYSVCTTWYEYENLYYLVDVFREKVEFPELKRTVINLYDKWSPTALLIEDKASGQSLIQDLRRETKLPTIAINPTKDKITRMAAVSPIFESGKIFLPNNAAWLHDYETETFSFPSSTHDDQMDSTSQFLNWERRRTIQKFGIRVI